MKSEVQPMSPLPLTLPHSAPVASGTLHLPVSIRNTFLSAIHVARSILSSDVCSSTTL